MQVALDLDYARDVRNVGFGVEVRLFTRLHNDTRARGRM